MMKPIQSFALGLAILTPLASAWPRWFPEMDALVVRQNNEDPKPAATPTTPASAGSPTPTPTPTGDSLNTAKPLPSGATGSAGTKTDASKSEPTFDDTDPPGSIVMITPAPNSQAINLYKIGDYVSWGWNYTDLQATPTAIDVLVSCSSMAQTWTLTQNMSFANPASFTWDSSVQKTDPAAPLSNNEYTLVVYDAASSVSATAAAGYLGVNSNFKFGMYMPQPYTPLNEWTCAVCKSAAPPSLNRNAIAMAAGMSMITVASFTWFVTGLGVF